jgi:hypothetical protein
VSAFEKVAEKLIREAIANGEFDDLPRKGEIDLAEYFATPEDLRLAHSVLKNANVVPTEVEMLREVASLRERLAAAKSEGERSELSRQLRVKELAVALVRERRMKR